jgi:amidohydrolase
MLLTQADIAGLTAWRHHLHQWPEVSGAEARTAQTVLEMVQDLQPDQIITGLGGHGVAAVFSGHQPGPTVLFRAELDALPIAEIGNPPHRSQVPGCGHMCGHDGHMTILAGLGRLVARARPAKGRIVLLFQPAEETGAGAEAVIADPQFAAVAPDYAFALHNLPGLPLGFAGLAAGPANCASRGLKLVLTGKTAHAAMPEGGLSPAPALARLIPALMALGPGGVVGPGFRLVTITHATLGEPSFGIAPGDAELWATLRTLTDGDMAALVAAAQAVIATETAGLVVEISMHDCFAACHNDPDATAILSRAITASGLPQSGAGYPMRWSEDFGQFGRMTKAAMFVLGAGEDHPRLHNPDYDFPDALIGPAVEVFDRVRRDLLG